MGLYLFVMSSHAGVVFTCIPGSFHDVSCPKFSSFLGEIVVCIIDYVMIYKSYLKKKGNENVMKNKLVSSPPICCFGMPTVQQNAPG